MSLYCIVEGCVNTSKNKDLTFFLLPHKTIRAEKWLTALKLKPHNIKRKYFCSDHFEMKCFTNTLRNRINYSAIPTLQKKVEDVPWPTKKESEKIHFLSQNLKASNPSLLENSQNNQLANPVIASLFVEANNNRKLEYVHHSKKKIMLETALDQYLCKRYIATKDKAYLEPLSGLATHDLPEPPCIIVKEESSKENCNYFGQVIGHESTVSHKNTFDLNSSCHFENLHASSINVNNKSPPNNMIQGLSLEQKSIASTSTMNTQLFTKESSMKYRQSSVNQHLNRTQIGVTSKSKQTAPADISFSQSDDCDSFAESVSAWLKKVKNPVARAKAKLNIQRILFEAETGIYDS